jgi:CD63 antigen
MVLIFILELSAGISGFVLKADTTKLIESSMNNTMKDFGNSTEITAAWNGVQYQVTF